MGSRIPDIERQATPQGAESAASAESAARTVPEQQSLSWQSAALGAISEAVFGLNHDGCVVELNPAAEQLTGWNLAAARGHSIEKILRLTEAVESRTVGHLPRRMMLRRPDGTLRPVQVTTRPLPCPGESAPGQILVVRDLADLRRSEVEIEATRERVQLAASAAELGIWVWHLPEDRVTWENDQPFQIFGNSPDSEPINGDRFKNEFILPEDRKRFEQTVETALVTGRPLNFVGRFRRVDGELRWLELTGRTQLQADGTPVRMMGTIADVTDRQRAEEQSRQSAEASAKFHTIFQQAAQFAGILAVDGTVIEANRLSIEGCGYMRDEVVGMPFWECGWWNRSTDLVEMIRQGCAQAARADVFQTETAYFHADGTRRYAHLTISPVIDERDQVLYLVPTGTDITDRIEAQAALRESLARTDRERRLYEAILSNTPDLAYVFDLQHRFIYINAGLLRMWGKSWDEAIGKTCLEIGYEPWHAEMHNREIDQVVATKQPLRGEVPFAGTFGRRIYDYIFVPVFNERGDVEAVAGTTRDVTERKQAEEQQRESEQRLRLALQGGRMSTWEWNVETDELTWSSNPGHTDGSGASFSGSLAVYEDSIHPEDRERIHQSLRATLEFGSDHQAEYRVLTADGTVRWVESRGRLVVDSDGRPTRVVGVHLDMTERKKAEHALQALAAELSESDRRKDEFLATLAHELRNPLAPIRNGLQVLRLSNHLTAETAELRDVMERQANHLVRLVDDLMEVSRVSRGKVDLRRETLDLAEVVEAALEISQALIHESGHRLSVQLPPTRVMLYADRVRLSQVLANLLTNSAKYMDAGGHIELKVTTEDDHAVISVRDTGLGIPTEMLPRLFEIFTQMDHTRGHSQGGLGIGLSLARSLVEMHDGKITAHSEGVGHGSTFTVRLPLQKESSVDGDASTIKNAADALPSRRILVVDDTRAALFVLERLLKTMGQQVRSANDALTGLELARQEPPEIVISDIGMPNVDGYEFARRLRQIPELKHVLLVALTGYGQVSDRQRAEAAGFDRHLVKPVSVDELHRLLASCPTSDQV